MDPRNSLRSVIELHLSVYRAVCCEPSPSGSDDTQPFLDNWTAAMRGEAIFLTGRVKGHPLLGDKQIRTSALIHVSSDRASARTLSRWYRLGTVFVPRVPGEHADGAFPAYLVAADDGTISLPLHMAMRIIAKRPQQIADLAFKAGYDDLVPQLTRLARAWPNMPKEDAVQGFQSN